MGKASSAKKVARAARAGGSRRPGQRRQLGFPAIIVGVVVAGVALVAFARDNREANAAPLSQANANFDHWHAALGVSDCGTFIFDGSPTGGAFFSDLQQDPQGIHTHGDGIMHIHPFLDSAGGRNARISIFFEDIGLQITDSTVTFPDGTVWDEADKTCPPAEGEEAGPGQIVIAVWNDAQSAADGEAPSEIVTDDFGSVRYRNDRQYFTLAYINEGEFDSIPVRPDIIAALNNLSDVPADQNIDAPSTTDTTVAGDTSSTTVDPTATTVAGDGSSTTTSEPAAEESTTSTTEG